MAEAVFKHQVKQLGLESHFEKIDSFGTGGWHTGENPDPRSYKTCVDNGVPVNHKAQQIKARHFDEFDYIVCMDESNERNLKRLRPGNAKRGNIYLFGHWNTDNKFRTIVDDPYYGGNDGFQYNFKQCEYFSNEFLKDVLKQ